MRYISLQDIKTYLGITEDTEDAILERLAASAENWLDTQFDGQFVGVPYIRVYTNDDVALLGDTYTLALWLDMPLLELSQLVDGTGEVHTNLVLRPYNGPPYWYIELDTWLKAPYKVFGVWGYTEDPPDIVKQIVLRLTGFWYRQRDSQLGYTATSDLGSVSTPAQIPADVVEMVKTLQAKYQLG